MASWRHEAAGRLPPGALCITSACRAPALMCHPPPKTSGQQQASGGEQKTGGFGYHGIKILHYGFEEVGAEFEYAKSQHAQLKC